MDIQTILTNCLLSTLGGSNPSLTASSQQMGEMIAWLENPDNGIADQSVVDLLSASINSETTELGAGKTYVLWSAKSPIYGDNFDYANSLSKPNFGIIGDT